MIETQTARPCRSSNEKIFHQKWYFGLVKGVRVFEIQLELIFIRGGRNSSKNDRLTYWTYHPEYKAVENVLTRDQNLTWKQHIEGGLIRTKLFKVIHISVKCCNKYYSKVVESIHNFFIMHVSQMFGPCLYCCLRGGYIRYGSRSRRKDYSGYCWFKVSLAHWKIYSLIICASYSYWAHLWYFRKA